MPSDLGLRQSEKTMGFELTTPKKLNGAILITPFALTLTARVIGRGVSVLLRSRYLTSVL